MTFRDLMEQARLAQQQYGQKHDVQLEIPQHTQECDDYRFMGHAATGDDPPCICNFHEWATEEERDQSWVLDVCGWREHFNNTTKSEPEIELYVTAVCSDGMH